MKTGDEFQAVTIAAVSQSFIESSEEKKSVYSFQILALSMKMSINTAFSLRNNKGNKTKNIWLS